MKTPHPYQLDAIELGVRRNLLLADQTGLGKTLTCIETAKQCIAQVGGYALVIAPKKTIAQWREAIAEQCPEATIIIGTKFFTTLALSKSPSTPTRPTWVLTHYEAVVAAAAELARVKWTIAILDEAHRIKTRSTPKRPVKRTEAVKMATMQAQRKIAATGTPWDRNPADVWSIAHWLYPKHYTSYWAFYEKHALVEYDYLGYAHVKGCKDREAFAKELSPFTLARTKVQVAPDLPPRIDRTERVELEPKQEKLYKQLLESKELVALLQLPEDQIATEVVVLNALSHLSKLLQLSTDPSLLGIKHISSGKLNWLVEYLGDNAEEKIVVFTRYRETALRLSIELEADLIIGGMKDDVRPGDEFLSGKKRILVGTIAAMREGLNLQLASTAIFIDQEWSAIAMNQAVDRIHRIDITEPKQVIFLRSTPADDLVYKAFTGKWTNAKLVFEFLNQLRAR